MDINKLLDALRHVESRGNRFAVSPKGARGPYQFMPKTAREYGLQGNDVYDEQKSRAAAHKKISGLISRYGIERGIAAYNMGEGNLEKVGGDYSKFPETAKYVPSVLAAYNGSQGDLKNAGFKGYQQRPQANIDNFPITPIQGVEPQSKVVEAKSMPVVNNLVDFAKEQKYIKHSKLMAQALAGAFDGYDPNTMVSGRVVEMHPITALAKALQTGFGAYEGARAIDKESDLEAKKASVLQDMINSGAPIDANSLLASGVVSPDKIAEALVKKQQQAEYNAVYGDNGEIMAFDKSNGKVTPTGQKSALYAPDSVYNRSLASSAGKGVEMTDPNDFSKYYIPQGMTNPAFGRYNQNQPTGQNTPIPTRLDQPTGLMSVPNSAPLPVTNSDPIVKGASPIDLKRQEAEAMIAPKVQEAQAVGDVKLAQDVDLAKEKAAIENKQKVDQADQKKEIAGKNIIDVLNTKINGKTVDELIDESTGSGIGAVADAGAAFFGNSTTGSVAADSLKTLQGWLVSNIPRMEGPQSDFDVLNYQQMAGKIADPNTPPDRKKAALASLKALVKKYETNPAEQTEAQPTYDQDAMRKKYGVK